MLDDDVPGTTGGEIVPRQVGKAGAVGVDARDKTTETIETVIGSPFPKPIPGHFVAMSVVDDADHSVEAIINELPLCRFQRSKIVVACLKLVRSLEIARFSQKAKEGKEVQLREVAEVNASRIVFRQFPKCEHDMFLFGVHFAEIVQPPKIQRDIYSTHGHIDH